jgi:CheY-like chemotaxis protein
VLLADDHDDSRTLLRIILEHRGSRVLEARDGEACLRLAREERPDVIVLDLFMPRLNGWQTAQALRADAGTADIPILAFTASAMADDHRRALDAGCRLVLTKPASPRDVADAIAALYAGLALLEESAALRQESAATREEAQKSRSESEAIRAATVRIRARAQELRDRRAATGAAVLGMLGGSDAAEQPPSEPGSEPAPAGDTPSGSVQP